GRNGPHVLDGEPGGGERSIHDRADGVVVAHAEGPPWPHPPTVSRGALGSRACLSAVPGTIARRMADPPPSRGSAVAPPPPPTIRTPVTPVAPVAQLTPVSPSPAETDIGMHSSEILIPEDT